MRDFLTAALTATVALAAFALLFFMYLLSPLYLILGAAIPFLVYRAWLLVLRRRRKGGLR